MTTTLLAVTGLSPAIVTETLWALATREDLRPHRVGFITTTVGAERLESSLFTPRPEWHDRSVWDELRRRLGAAPDELIAELPQVITLADGSSGRAQPLADIRTPAENDAAAEFIFARVWDIVRDRDQRLFASIAGGRKTMGALLHAAVSLIGREDDRLSHVLVNPPFDTLPGFFFPDQPDCPLLDREGRALETANADIQLADIPFVPLRNRFRELDDLPASFLALRSNLSERLKRDAERPVTLHIDHDRGELEVDGTTFRLRPRALVVLDLILRCNEKNQIPPDQATAAEVYDKLRTKNPDCFGPHHFHGLAAEDIRRELNHIRSKLRDQPWQPAQRTLRQPPFVRK